MKKDNYANYKKLIDDLREGSIWIKSRANDRAAELSPIMDKVATAIENLLAELKAKDTGLYIGGKAYDHITISGKDGEVLAVITGDKIVEKGGVAVTLAELS